MKRILSALDDMIIKKVDESYCVSVGAAGRVLPAAETYIF